MTMRVRFDPTKVDVLAYQLAGYSFIRKWLKPTDVVLDVGCGEGYTTLFLAEKCAHICGIDSDLEIITENNDQYWTPNCHFIHSDIFPFKQCSIAFDVRKEKSKLKKTSRPLTNYDVIVCRDLIEHMTAKRGDSLISKLHGMLRGHTAMLFLGTVRQGVVTGRPSEQGHIHEYSYQELKDLLESYFKRVIFFSQTDEVVTLVEPKNMCWRWIIACWGKK